jgi:hypothetical protein
MVLGLMAGLHTATWGMYKDAIHEGFTLGRFLRSVIVSGVSAPVIVLLTGLDPLTASGLVVLFGVTYCTERAIVEFWKTFIRFVDQSKFTIPMQFHVFGQVIPQKPTRWLIAACRRPIVATGLGNRVEGQRAFFSEVKCGRVVAHRFGPSRAIFRLPCSRA